MFGQEHYVPVLRWQRGEQKALAALEGSDKDSLTPLIEVPPDDFLPTDPATPINLKARFPRLTAALELAVGTRSVFVDFGLLDDAVLSSNLPPVQSFFALLSGGGVAAIPVVRLRRPAAYQAAIRTLSKHTGEIALRLARGDLARPTLQDEILALLAAYGLKHEDVHLIVDLGLLAESAFKFLYVCSRVPELSRWRTFTALAGSFPKDLGHLSIGTHFLPSDSIGARR